MTEVPREELREFAEVFSGRMGHFVPCLDGAKPGAIGFTYESEVEELTELFEKWGVSYRFYSEEHLSEGKLNLEIAVEDGLLEAYHNNEVKVGELIGVPEEDFLWWEEDTYTERVDFEGKAPSSEELVEAGFDLPSRSLKQTILSGYTTYRHRPNKNGLERKAELGREYRKSLQRFERLSGVPVFNWMLFDEVLWGGIFTVRQVYDGSFYTVIVLLFPVLVACSGVLYLREKWVRFRYN